MRAVATAVLAIAASGVLPAEAVTQAPALARVQSLMAAGNYTDARTTLDEWWVTPQKADVPGSDMSLALVLRARLAPDPAAAEADYLAIALGYPTSDHAPEALLRLGQGLLATGDASRAAAYLERLVADYPGQPQRLTGLLWLARASSAARRPAAACRAARQGLQDARDPDLAAMLRVEADAACSSATAAADPAAQAATPAAARPEPATPEPATPEAAESGTGDWAVQSGAFRQRATADALMARLRDAGYSPRLVRVPRSELLRVRVGRFTTSSAASAMVTRLQRSGFDAVVVRDAAQERQP